MASHKFHLGQKVAISSVVFNFDSPQGLYEILRLLPTNEGDNLYRVKSTMDGHERVVRESQLQRDGRRAVEALAQSLYEASDSSGTPWARRDRVIRDAWVVAARKRLSEG
jgi:hypothetical protein